jgi:hypothetical protein
MTQTDVIDVPNTKYYNMTQIGNILFEQKGDKIMCADLQIMGFDNKPSKKMNDMKEILTAVINDPMYRHTSVTSNNKESSRSHVLITIKIDKYDNTRVANSKTLYFADYAGVENTFLCESFDELIKLANTSNDKSENPANFKRTYDDQAVKGDIDTPCELNNDAVYKNITTYITKTIRLDDNKMFIHPDNNVQIFGSSTTNVKPNGYVSGTETDLEKYFKNNDMRQTYKIMGLDFDKANMLEIMQVDISKVLNDVLMCIADIYESHDTRTTLYATPEEIKEGKKQKFFKQPHLLSQHKYLQFLIDNGTHWNTITSRVGRKETIKILGINLTKTFFRGKLEVDEKTPLNTNIGRDNMLAICKSHVNYIASSIHTLLLVYLSCNCRKREGVFLNRSIQTTREALNTIIQKKMEDRLFSVPIMTDDCRDLYCNPLHGRCFSDDHMLIKNKNNDVSKSDSNIISNYIIGNEQLSNIEFILLGVFNNSERQNNSMAHAYIDIEELIIEYKRSKLFVEFQENPVYKARVIKFAELERRTYTEDDELVLFSNYISNLTEKDADVRTYEINDNYKSAELAVTKYLNTVVYYEGKGITTDQVNIIRKLTTYYLKNPANTSGLLRIINNQIILNENTPMGALRYLDSVAKYNYGYTKTDDIEPMCSRSYQYQSDQLHGTLPVSNQM